MVSTFTPPCFAMSDMATSNLPSRDFEKASQFYGALGFSETWRDGGWKTLKHGDLTLGVLPPHPGLDPLTSWFSCCLRLDELDAFYAVCIKAGLPEGCTGQPRLHPPKIEPWGGCIGAVVDPNGKLIRLIQNCSFEGKRSL
jgi:predicted enzyme related to lactoylglutathione lyase